MAQLINIKLQKEFFIKDLIEINRISVTYGTYTNKVKTTEGLKQGIEDWKCKYIDIPEKCEIEALREYLIRFANSLVE